MRVVTHYALKTVTLRFVLATVLMLLGVAFYGCDDPNKASLELVRKAEAWIDNPTEQQQIEAIKYVQVRLSEDIIKKIQTREEYCLYAAADTCKTILKDYPKTANAKRAAELMQRIDWRLSHNEILKRFRSK